MSFETNISQEPQPEEQLSYALGTLRSEMRNIARNSVFNVAAYFPDLVSEAQLMTRRLAGRRIRGGADGVVYYVADSVVEQYQRVLLGSHKNTTNDFDGLIVDLEDIEVKVDSDGRTARRLCLAIEALARADNPGLTAYFEERGWDFKLNHPFDSEDRFEQTVWIPVDSIVQRTLTFPDRPSD